MDTTTQPPKPTEAEEETPETVQASSVPDPLNPFNNPYLEGIRKPSAKMTRLLNRARHKGVPIPAELFELYQIGNRHMRKQAEARFESYLNRIDLLGGVKQPDNVQSVAPGKVIPLKKT